MMLCSRNVQLGKRLRPTPQRRLLPLLSVCRCSLRSGTSWCTPQEIGSGQTTVYSYIPVYSVIGTETYKSQSPEYCTALAYTQYPRTIERLPRSGGPEHHFIRFTIEWFCLCMTFVWGYCSKRGVHCIRRSETIPLLCLSLSSRTRWLPSICCRNTRQILSFHRSLGSSRVVRGTLWAKKCWHIKRFFASRPGGSVWKCTLVSGFSQSAPPLFYFLLFSFILVIQHCPSFTTKSYLPLSWTFN
jgi:hypothetical protein